MCWTADINGDRKNTWLEKKLSAKDSVLKQMQKEIEGETS